MSKFTIFRSKLRRASVFESEPISTTRSLRSGSLVALNDGSLNPSITISGPIITSSDKIVISDQDQLNANDDQVSLSAIEKHEIAEDQNLLERQENNDESYHPVDQVRKIYTRTH